VVFSRSTRNAFVSLRASFCARDIVAYRGYVLLEYLVLLPCQGGVAQSDFWTDGVVKGRGRYLQTGLYVRVCKAYLVAIR